MADWADDEAARYIFEWEKRWRGEGYGSLPVSIIARTLRKAKADGWREAAVSMRLPKVAREFLFARADQIERGGDALANQPGAK